MPIVPLASGAYKREAGIVPETQCYNMFVEKDESGISPDGILRIQRPGKETVRVLDTPIRALTINPATRQTMSVAGNTFYVEGSAIDIVGPPGSGQARIVPTQLGVMIYFNARVFLYNYSTVVEVNIPPGNFPPVDVDQLNGYFIILLENGTFYWLVPGESVLDPLNFATAESSNDQALAVRQIGEEFWIFGSRTVEPWQPTGNADLPFERASGRVIPHGCLAGNTVCRFDNTLLWVGDDCNVYRGGGVAEIISTPAIAERIRRRTVLTEELSAWVLSIDGHTFWMLRIPGQGTFGYDALTREWCRWSSPGVLLWDAWVGDSFNGVTYAGAASSGRIWLINPQRYGDDNVVFERKITGSLPVVGKPPRNDSISVGVGAEEDTSVRIRWRDGQTDYPDYYDELDVRAPYDICSIYRLGQPVPPYREVEVSFTGETIVRVAGCLANEGWQ